MQWNSLILGELPESVIRTFCHLGRLVLEESVQQEKVDDTGQEMEGKDDEKQADERKSKVPLGSKSKSKASETILNINVKTNKQMNTADITRYFKKK